MRLAVRAGELEGGKLGQTVPATVTNLEPLVVSGNRPGEPVDAVGGPLHRVGQGLVAAAGELAVRNTPVTVLRTVCPGSRIDLAVHRNVGAWCREVEDFVLDVAIGTVDDVPFVHEVNRCNVPPDIETTHCFHHGPRIGDRRRVAPQAWLVVCNRPARHNKRQADKRQQSTVMSKFFHHD